MPHFRVDDGLHSHPKIRAAGLDAIGLWVVAGAHCMAYLTDGFVPEWFVKTWPRGTSLAKRLVAADLWEPVADGWQFHDFNAHGRQDTREQIEAARNVAAARQERWRKRARNAVTHGVSNGVTNAVSNAYPTQPNPTQPIPKETLGGEGQEGNARENTPPRPHCNVHTDNAPGPCGACAARRRWDTQHGAQVVLDELETRRNAKTAAAAIRAACTRCDDAGWRLADDGTVAEPATRCNHQGTAHA